MEKYRLIFHSFIMVINTAKLEFESFRKCDYDSVYFPSAINNDVWIAATFLHTIPTHGHMQDNKMTAIMEKHTIIKIIHKSEPTSLSIYKTTCT